MAQYSDQTKEAILQRMLDASPADIDVREGSITYDLTSPAAIETALAYIELDNVLTFGFASEDQPSEYLDLRASEMGLTRKAAVKATGQVTFTGTNGTVIPSGTRVSTEGDSPIYFVTAASGTISGTTVTVTAEAEVGGIAGNVAIGAIKLVVGNLSGVTAVNNSAVFDGGSDEESDSDLLARYFDRVRKPATSGNANHYVLWAKERPGVGDAKAYPVWSGNGTVKVVLLDTEKTAPASTVVDDVTDYIESVRPVGATVTVVAATEVAVNVTATLTMQSGYTAAGVKPTIEQGIVDYLKTLAFTDPIVRYSRIANIILDTEGVLDYSGLTVNGGSANITIADGSVAVKGSVTLT